jgi:hypothetical protein
MMGSNGLGNVPSDSVKCQGFFSASITIGFSGRIVLLGVSNLFCFPVSLFVSLPVIRSVGKSDSYLLLTPIISKLLLG